MWLHQKPTHMRTQSKSHRFPVECLPECSPELTDNPTRSTESEEERDISKDLKTTA